MKRILRSIIPLQDDDLDAEDARKNCAHLRESDLAFDNEDDKEIWEFVRSFYRRYQDVPGIGTVRDHFRRKHDNIILDRLDEIAIIDKIYIGSDFQNLVREEFIEQKQSRAADILATAAHANYDGIEVGSGRNTEEYKGTQDAFRYVLEHADDFMISDGGTKLRGDITLDADGMEDEFEHTVENPEGAWGIVTGLDEIDQTCRGIKSGELWLHAGFTGHLKTSMALTWAYKASVMMGYNVYYFSLEMPYEQIRRIIFSMHSQHPKFEERGFEPMPYNYVRDGIQRDDSLLTDRQKNFFREVIDDFRVNAGKKYGSLIVERPDGKADLNYIAQRMEIAHQSQPVHLAFVDHFGLVDPTRSTGNYYTDLNAIIRNAKSLAMNFSGGDGVALVGLHQINREGKDHADKNEGRYRLQALADSNEAERSSDVISYTYLNEEHRQNNEVLIGCLKNRDNDFFPHFTARVNFDNRYIYNMDADFKSTSAENGEEIASMLEDV